MGGINGSRTSGISANGSKTGGTKVDGTKMDASNMDGTNMDGFKINGSKIDLHIHSGYSGDGEFTPKEIVSLCRENHIQLAAITDHNSVRGVDEAMAAAGSLRIITGVELDCTAGGRNFHLLGYGFDHTLKEFGEMEQDILRQEKEAAEQKIVLFRKATGIPVGTEEILAKAENGVVTGELIAETVLNREDSGNYEILMPYLPGGKKSDMPYVRLYWDFFSEGKAAYVPIHYQSLTDAAALIHRAGGLTVLAHPGQNLTVKDPLLPTILAEEIDGIEVFSTYHSRETAAYYMETAKKYHLFVTCGSDFHGKNKPSISLGRHGGAFWNDYGILEEMKSAGLL